MQRLKNGCKPRWYSISAELEISNHRISLPKLLSNRVAAANV
jgi:hypothetical protein